MARLLVILSDSFANFAGGNTHDWIRGSIVVGCPAKYLDSKGAFLEKVGLSRQGVFNSESQKRRKAAAVAEVRVDEQALQLFMDRGLFCLVQHPMTADHCSTNPCLPNGKRIIQRKNSLIGF